MIPGKTSLGLLAGLFSLSLMGCASTMDMEDLQARVDANTAQIKTLKHQGGGSGSVSQDSVRLADIENRLDQQKARLATLRGRLDVIDHRLDTLMEKIDEQNARIKSMTPLTATISPPGNPPAKVSPPLSGTAVVPTPSASPPPPATPTVLQPSANVLYRQAMNDYQTGHYQLSKKEFAQVVTLYPQSHLASSAEFWVGQSDFNMKHYDEAASSFLHVIKNYPSSPKRAVAYFKLGRSYESLGKKKEAIHSYRRVLELFPLERQLDELAKRRLSRLE
ncbi:MAG: tetratricopeptide repeat protein [Nitrospirae bacterium]|jgi:tol-pal system protein YbgF|nr:tetratricopeptide repeat protein [Nitrospirota bacterium]MDA8150405.1 tetratricopeptide repeat protein [Nitrospiraceae bacterium]